MQHNIIMNCSFSYQKKPLFIILIRIRRKQISFFVPIFKNIILLIVTVIITERFNIHCSGITWLAATWFSLLGCAWNFINAPIFYNTISLHVMNKFTLWTLNRQAKIFLRAPILYCWNWVKTFSTTTLFHNSQNKIFSKHLTPMWATEIGFNTSQSVNDFYSLALETGTKTNNLIINSQTSHRRCSVRKGVLRKFAKFTGKHLCQSLFNKKETLAQVFSCEFCELSKKTFSYRTPPVAASE